MPWHLPISLDSNYGTSQLPILVDCYYDQFQVAFEPRLPPCPCRSCTKTLFTPAGHTLWLPPFFQQNIHEDPPTHLILASLTPRHPLLLHFIHKDIPHPCRSFTMTHLISVDCAFLDLMHQYSYPLIPADHIPKTLLPYWLYKQKLINKLILVKVAIKSMNNSWSGNCFCFFLFY